MVVEREEDMYVRTWLNNITDWTSLKCYQLIRTAEHRQVRGGTETNRQCFADICKSRQSQFGSKSRLYCQIDALKGVLHPRLVFGLFMHFSQKLQHIGNK